MNEPKDLTVEQWREYEWVSIERGVPCLHVYRIEDPFSLVVGETTHRVLDMQGIVHCVPGVGLLGCVLRWKSRPGFNAIQF